ncbi:MAG TPA: isoprenylcysteine carboxylmethyltransferase family protein [Solirubrobacteraceae bacterium]|nr:isoprenylcysteine carboxylmethyltransferase family protein [Solirubrobacteraceae bacterium]
MHALKLAIALAWIPFWIYWLASATRAKESRPGRRWTPVGALSALAVILIVRVFRTGGLAVHSSVLGGIGAALFASGLALAIWARVHLGRNWGMPMTERLEPELITSGPYACIRHPIYTGLLLAMFGTALVTNLTGLIVAACLSGVFVYAARVEERNLTAAFPSAYPAYQARTKMLIPFIL